MKYFIITYGCQMNQSDSQRIATLLESKGYLPASRIEEADFLVVNMCSVRQSAVDRIYGLIPKFKKLKEKNLRLKTVLTGCVLKTDKRKFRQFFDSIWETRNYFKVPPKSQKKLIAFIPISSGCNNLCSYCVVPFTRGPLICRNHQEILREVKKELKKGIKEICLLGQNVNDYISPTNNKIDFPKLLKQIVKIPGDFRISFISPNPKDFSDELIEIMAISKKIVKRLNLPVQSGDNQILKKMNRPYTVEQYKNLIKKIREKIPDINLSTDIIVGFPGETKKQFENTVKLFKEIKFDSAFIAKYSPRPNTAASKMKDNVSLKEKKRREQILREILKKNG